MKWIKFMWKYLDGTDNNDYTYNLPIYLLCSYTLLIIQYLDYYYYGSA